MKRAFWGLATAALTLWGTAAVATPSTNIWNPSTDIQAKGVYHVGVDTYFSVAKNVSKPVNFPIDLGLTYGLPYGFEIGIDLVEPAANPVLFNAKWGLPEHDQWPAVAVGIMGVGIHRASGTNQVYGLLSKTFGNYGRVTAGGYFANPNLVGNDNVGGIVAWDKSFGPKWWASIDYATGRNACGGLGIGAAYKLAPNVGVIAGYTFFPDNAVANDTVTLQFDLDF